MKPDEPLPLWLESIPDREPWRRGRDVVGFISVFILLGFAGFVLRSILLGDLPTFLIAAGGGALALVFLYLVWIGQNWPRWIVAPVFACAGFAGAVRAVVQGDGPLFLGGLFCLTIFFYLALAPSVYAFARHQREHVRFVEAAIVGAVFLLVVVSVGSGLYGFYLYDTELQQRATVYAAKAFNQVFLYHDAEFLRANLSDKERLVTPREFVLGIANSLGQPRWVGEFRGVFTTRLARHELALTGLFQIPVLFQDTTPIWVNLEVSRSGDGWQIDRVGWEYRPGAFNATP